MLVVLHLREASYHNERPGKHAFTYQEISDEEIAAAKSTGVRTIQLLGLRLERSPIEMCCQLGKEDQVCTAKAPQAHSLCGSKVSANPWSHAHALLPINSAKTEATCLKYDEV